MRVTGFGVTLRAHNVSVRARLCACSFISSPWFVASPVVR